MRYCEDFRAKVSFDSQCVEEQELFRHNEWSARQNFVLGR